MEKQRRRAAKSLLEFTKMTYLEYQPGWFHRKLAAILDRFFEDVNAGRSPQLILTAPPRHGKSELVSRRFPAYALGRNPNLRVIATSHTAQLAETFSNEVRRIIDSDIYRCVFPKTRLATSGQLAAHQVGLWEIARHRGVYRAAGIGGAITGMGAEILIIDDPITDAAKANSPVQREQLWGWFTSTAYTRLSPGGGVIVMCTRWHPDDLVGRLLTAQGKPWQLYNFAALATEDCPDRRRGEPLCPERFSLDALLDIHQQIGPYCWEALYQQQPLPPPDSGIVRRDWIRYYRELPSGWESGYVCQSWDCSFKNEPGSSFVAGHVWARVGPDYYLVDRVHDRMGFTSTLAAIRAMHAKYPFLPILIEDQANGPAIIEVLRQEFSGVIAINPQGGKRSRLEAVAPLWEAGNVHLPDPSIAAWVSDVITELVNFPQSTYSDDVDAASQALVWLSQHKAPPPFVLGLVERPGQEYSEIHRRAAAKVTDAERLTGKEEDVLVFGSLLDP